MPVLLAAECWACQQLVRVEELIEPLRFPLDGEPPSYKLMLHKVPPTPHWRTGIVGTWFCKGSRTVASTELRLVCSQDETNSA